MADDSLFAIAEAQAEDRLFISPISAWEAALALQKNNPARRPNLMGQDAATWFRRGRTEIGARVVNVGQKIAVEAAKVPVKFGHSDPGDCYILATARARRLSIITRDGVMAAISAENPNYVTVIPC